MSRVAVMGSGSWGTAFAMILADAGGDVVMWSRDADLARQINDEHVNERYHPGIRLPAGLRGVRNRARPPCFAAVWARRRLRFGSRAAALRCIWGEQSHVSGGGGREGGRVRGRPGRGGKREGAGG